MIVPFPIECSDADSIGLLASAMGLSSTERPFHWQTRLLASFRANAIPDAFVPTGLDKTSVMASWPVARTCGASVPRRLIYVVDRFLCDGKWA